MNYLIIDQGTSSTKAFLFNKNGRILFKDKIKHQLQRPKALHVESDPKLILNAIKTLVRRMVQLSNNTTILQAGLAVQRSTFLFWEKETCKPVTPAISWQDSRSHSIVEEKKRLKQKLWEKTGTPLSPHFGGPKFLYLLRQDKTLAKRIKNGELYFGPLSAYLTHAITGNPYIDESIACRSLLYNIKKGIWSSFALDVFEVPLHALPQLTTVQYHYGSLFHTKIPLSIVIGDQQAALIGYAGLKKGTAGANFGTSGSIQYNVGHMPVKAKGLISSVLFSNKEKYYMVEGTINACNAIFYYLEGHLGIPHSEMKWDKRVLTSSTKGILIPGFIGLAAPYWTKGFNNIYIDLNNDPNQIIRAGMESIGFLANDILNCYKKLSGKNVNTLMVAGGASKSPLLQFISDVTSIEVWKLSLKDRTAMGVYKLLKGNMETDLRNVIETKFIPKQNINIKKKKWRKALKQVI